MSGETASGRVIAGGEQAVLRRAGFEPFSGARIDRNRVLLRLIARFARATLTGFWPIALAVSVLVPPLAAAGYVIARAVAPELTQIQELGVPVGGEVDFAIDVVGYVFTACAAWMLALQAFFVAPQIGADIRQGALLLYFSRPLSRADYLFARVMAPTAIGTIGFVLAGTIVFAALGANLGWTPPPPFPEPEGVAITGMLTWPLGLLAFILSGVFVSLATTLCAHGCSIAVRSGGQGPLLLLGSVVGSIGLSWAGQLTWGKTSLARAIDLHHGLDAPLFFGLRLLDPVAAPPVAMLDAAIGGSAWLGLAALSAWAVRRRLAQPPSTPGRP